MKSFRPVRTSLAAALAFVAAPAMAQTFSQTVFIGDSLTDSGHFRPALIGAVGPNGALIGRFSTNPTWVWSEFVADYYGTNATSANQGGTNYAVGGARTGTNTSGALGPIPSLATQTSNYLAANGGRADPRALYTVWGGANDLFTVAGGAPPVPTIPNAVASEVGVAAALQSAGARYILVPNVPDLGQTPQFRAGGPAQQAAGTQLATTYNNALYAGLASAGVRFIPLDTFTLIREVVANPTPFGITNVTGTACNPQITASSVTCSPLNYVNPSAPETYAFADGVHPSSKAHRILADYALATLEGPRKIALLPYSASNVGRARADRVSAHVLGASKADGMRWWADVRGDSQRYDHDRGTGAGFDGGGPTLTFGIDWASGNLVYGAFAGYGRQKIDFGSRGGDFDQKDTSIGGFIGWQSDGGLWANAQISYTQLAYDVTRKVRLDQVTRAHHGSPDGDNLSVGAEAGWEFGEGKLRHGPVVGVLSQQIDVDGYAENDPSLSTSLAFPDQKFDSLIGRAGWQASYAINDHLTPYARLTYDREFEDPAKEAFGRVQSLPGTGNYAVPGIGIDRDYGTLQLGARSKLFGLDANVGASVTLGQEGGNNASVFATLGKGF